MISNAPEPGRISPFFINDLLLADWDLVDGPMRLSQELTIQDVDHAPFFLNSRVLLQSLAREKSVPATEAGNLNRAFVNAMFDHLALSRTFREMTKQVCKVVNESDVWLLHIVRVVCECAKLVSHRNKRFQLTKTGRDLLPDERGGELYRRLFISYFRRFNLSYDFAFRDVPDLQSSMAVILWRLSSVARDWVPVRGLAPKILLPEVFNQLRGAMISPFDSEEWILSGYVLNPLFILGLIELQKGEDWPSVRKTDVIRITPLWRKFISFAPNL